MQVWTARTFRLVKSRNDKKTMIPILEIPTLLGPGGLQVNNLTEDDGEHWRLVCPFKITNADGNRIGLMWELYSRPTPTEFALDGEPTVFDVPLANGAWNHSSPGLEDMVYMELKNHLGPDTKYRMVVTPDGGEPVQIDFSRDVGGVRTAAFFVGPRPTVLPPPPAPGVPTAEVRAKFGWKTPQ